jgi:hypothetical protein
MNQKYLKISGMCRSERRESREQSGRQPVA